MSDPTPEDAAGNARRWIVNAQHQQHGLEGAVADLLALVARLREERDAVDARLSFTADLLNTELRENYGAAYQVGPDDDWREAIKTLVDGARHGVEFQYRNMPGQVEAAEAERDRLREALRLVVTHAEERWSTDALGQIAHSALRARPEQERE